MKIDEHDLFADDLAIDSIDIGVFYSYMTLPEDKSPQIVSLTSWRNILNHICMHQ